jgi:putative membrane protein
MPAGPRADGGGEGRSAAYGSSRMESEQSRQRAFRRVVPHDPRMVGDEPDYRFTLANERTFLAWVRTALALAAGGLAAIGLLPDLPGSETLGLALLALSVLMAGSSYRRWALNERSMRLAEPLPPSRLPLLMAIGTALVALGAGLMFVIDQS